MATTNQRIYNVSNGKNTIIPTGYIKIGRINQTRAKQAHIKAGDILINENHIIHITSKHNKELSALHISSIDYIDIIVAKYNEIRLNNDNSILLVKTNPEKPNDTITIELCMNIKYQFWEIKTAQPRSNVAKNKLLWKQKKRHS